MTRYINKYEQDKQKELGFETYMRGMTGGVEVLTPDAEQLRALEGVKPCEQSQALKMS